MQDCVWQRIAGSQDLASILCGALGYETGQLEAAMIVDYAQPFCPSLDYLGQGYNGNPRVPILRVNYSQQRNTVAQVALLIGSHIDPIYVRGVLTSVGKAEW